MPMLRNPRFHALLLVIAAVLGLIAANSPVTASLEAFESQSFVVPALNLDLDVTHLVEELLLPLFFFLVGLELKHELLHGHFKRKVRLVTPSLAAVFGVALPALIFVAVCWQDPAALRGWAIPTATDITFALSVFVLFGASMPAASRTFLVAFATIDDVIAILLIAVLFGSGLNVVMLAAAALSLLAFWVVQKRTNLHYFSVAIGLVAWYFTYHSGVHPTVVGVALGLLVRSDLIHVYDRKLQPWVGVAVLPLFAFLATGISLAGAQAAFTSLVFLGVVLRPLGKIVGITLGALLGEKLIGEHRDPSMTWRDYLAVSTLGGIGFTVSILVTGLALAGRQVESSAALLATVISALVSVVIGAFALQYRRLGKAKRA